MISMRYVSTKSRLNLHTSARLCLSTNTSTTHDQNAKKTMISTQPKRLKILDLIKGVPSGMKLLLKDVERYYNINAASHSRNNDWTNKGGLNYIPRRQSEQQRQLIRDLWKVAAPLAFVNIPILGNFVFPLIALNPSFFLTKHFYAFEHHRRFVSENYRSRKGAFGSTANEFFNLIMTNSECKDMKKLLKVQDGDDAGVLLDGLEFFNLCDQIDWKSISISGTAMNHLGTSSGMSSLAMMITPNYMIRSRLQLKVKDIVLDDCNLLREGQHDLNCISLSDAEVLDACELRGLPCNLGNSYDTMRRCLSNYLSIMKPVHDKIGKRKLIKDYSGVMFMMYLQPVRYQLSKLG